MKPTIPARSPDIGLTPDQERAGEAFAEDWRAARPQPRVREFGRRPHGGASPGDGFSLTAAQKERYRRACRELGELQAVAVHCCCHGRSATSWAEEHCLPPGQGTAALRLALSVLARFYGFGRYDAA